MAETEAGDGLCIRFEVGVLRVRVFSIFFFNDTATTEIYTLSLHDALPICDTGFKFKLKR